MSWPCASMKCLCSMSLSRTCCFRYAPLRYWSRYPIHHVLHQMVPVQVLSRASGPSCIFVAAGIVLKAMDVLDGLVARMFLHPIDGMLPNPSARR